MIEISGYNITEKIYESAKSILYSGTQISENKKVIIKIHNTEYPDPKDLIRFQLEFAIGKMFHHKNIVQHYEIRKYKNNLAIITEDFGGVSFSEGFNFSKESLVTFLEYGIQITDALEEIHKQKVIHKDINLRNMILNQKEKTVKIIDFGISSQVTKENQNATSPEVLEGTLLYMSPEQTGRMNRAIDYRSDFYSLGVAFYEILTGKVPFDFEDPMEIVHSHIAKTPISPEILNPKIPSHLSKIILKLLSKSADERYQTCHGLKKDFEYSLQVEKKEIELDENFIPGTQDDSGKFIVPGKLYGREKEIEFILDSYQKIIVGKKILLMVSGYSGIGKTSVIREIHKPIVESKGYFLEGKFDQFKRNIPYDSIIQAFTILFKQLLTENTSKINSWKNKFLTNLNSELPILSSILPDIKFIIGDYNISENSEIKEDESMIQSAFIKLINVIAVPEHPLVLFLDDLQWADTATIKLIYTILSSKEAEQNTSLLLIGAYRDNEVNLSHPLILLLDRLKKESEDLDSILEVNLNPLTISDIKEYLVDSFKYKTESKEIIELSNLTLEKTNGNPFFIGEFLKNLCIDKLIYFKEKWIWDIKKIKSSGVTDNVVDLMMKNIKKLNSESMELLKLASFLGNSFDLKNLSLITKKNYSEIIKLLSESISEGFIFPIDDSYKYFLQNTEELKDINPRFKFLHDRIHQGAYLLADESEKKIIHLKIGRLFLNSLTSLEKENILFDLVNHLNSGLELIHDEKEKLEILKLNFEVADKAKTSSAYEVALTYLTIAKALHKDEYWIDEYDFSFKLFSELAKCEYICGNFEKVNENFEILNKNAKTNIEKAGAYFILIELSTNAGKHHDVCKFGGEALSLFGIDFNIEKVKSGLITEMKLITSTLKDKNPSYILDLPNMIDRDFICVMDILTAMHASVFFSDKMAGTYIAFQMVNISLKYGNVKTSSMGYAMYGASLVGLGDSKTGLAYAEVAIRLNDQFKNVQLIPKLSFVMGATINHWVNPALSDIEILDRGIESGLESGDMIYVGFLYAQRIANGYLAGKNLNELIEEGIKNSKSPYVSRSEEMLSILETVKQTALCLTGKTKSNLDLSDEDFEEEKYKSKLEKVQLTSSLFLYDLSKVILNYLFDKPEESLELLDECEKYAPLSSGFYITAELPFFSSLTYLALCENADEEKKKEYIGIINKNQKKTKRWLENSKENFLHKYNLVAAEIARIEKRELEAISLYESAIENASTNNFIHHHGIANELAGKFYLSLGNKKVAKLYFSEARYAFSNWGSTTKVEYLETKYPDLVSKIVESNLRTTTAGTIQTTTTTQATTQGSSSFLDISTITKATQAISSEILIANLLEKMISISIENAGAERGVLLLEKDDLFFVEADGKVNQENISTLNSIPLEKSSESLPLSLVNYVIRTKSPIVVADGLKDTRFYKDPYLVKSKMKSMLCMPIINAGKLTGILYLENNLIANAFTTGRLELLKVLAGQSSISIENARLYSNMSELNNAYRKFVPKEFLDFLGKKNITDISLGDQVQKEMTVLFSDIRSFTSISEKMTAEENFNFLNAYLKRIGPIIRKHNGFIDKYIGDAIMALFPTNPDDALNSGIDMLKELRLYNKSRIKKDYDPIFIGIGMHTGSLMLGTIGESERMEGTVISDNVNLASRIEGLTKHYGANILISDSTLDKLKDKSIYHSRILDRVIVKGKNQPVSIIEILDGQPDFVIELFMNTKIDFEKALSAYLEKNFDKANFLFRKVLSQNANDKASRMYLQRSEYYGINGVPLDWVGVETMKNK